VTDGDCTASGERGSRSPKRANQHRRHPLAEIKRQSQCSQYLVAGAQDIGRADTAGPDPPDVAKPGEPRHHQAERNGPEQVADDG